MTTLKDAKFEDVKKMFYGKASNILIYKTDRKRTLPQDQNKINNYKDELIEQYNAMAALAGSVYDDLEQKEKDKITQSFTKFYKPRLIDALNFIGFHVDVPKDFEVIDPECVGALPDEGAIGQDDDIELELEEHESFKQAMQSHMQTNTDGKSQSKLEPSKNVKTHLKPDAKASRPYMASRFQGMKSNDFDNMFSLDPNRINANRAGRQNNLPPQTVSNPNFETHSRANTNVRPNVLRNASRNANYDVHDWNYSQNSQGDDNDDVDQISELNFYNLCARTFTETYAGDPLALRPFINKINMVHRMCQHEGHEAILKDSIMAHVKGLAADVLPADPESIEAIKKTLLEKIKPENSKVVKGKLMALKADRNNLIEYTKKAEQLAENLKRSLILENIPYENANKMVIDDTIELCRANTNSVLVKAGLIGYQFKDAKEVLAKYTVETRKDVEEKQILSFRQTNSNSNRNFGNNFQRRGNGRGNYYQNQNRGQNQGRNYQNYQNNGYRGNYYQSRGNSRGNGNGNGRGRGGNYRGRGNYYQNGRQNRMYYAENERAPPSGATQAQNVQSTQADRQ